MNSEGLYEISTVQSLNISVAYAGDRLSFNVLGKYNPSNYHPYVINLYAVKPNRERTLLRTRRFEVYPQYYTLATFVEKSDNGAEILEACGDLGKRYPTLTFRFELKTYADESFKVAIGESVVDKTVTITNDAFIAPEVDVTLEPICELGDFYVQKHSRVRVILSNPVNKFGDSAENYHVAVDNQSYIGSGTQLESDDISGAGDVSVTVTLVSHLGRTRRYKRTISVIPYSPPAVVPLSGNTNIQCDRCDSEGNIVDDGTFIQIAASAMYSAIMHDGKTYNSCDLQYRYKLNDPNEPWYAYEWEDVVGTEVRGGIVSHPLGYDDIYASASYLVQVRAIDEFGEEGVITLPLPTARVYLHKAGSLRSIGIGKYAEESNVVDISEDMTVIIRGKLQTASSQWKNLDPEQGEQGEANFGLCPYGCYYKVDTTNNRVTVVFRGVYDPRGTFKISAQPIPEDYRPKREVRSIFTSGNARGYIKADGYVYLDTYEDNSDATAIDIDGLIEYWTDI